MRYLRYGALFGGVSATEIGRTDMGRLYVIQSVKMRAYIGTWGIAQRLMRQSTPHSLEMRLSEWDVDRARTEDIALGISPRLSHFGSRHFKVGHTMGKWRYICRI